MKSIYEILIVKARCEYIEFHCTSFCIFVYVVKRHNKSKKRDKQLQLIFSMILAQCP